MNSFASVLAVFGLGSTEIMVILFIVLLLFGAKKLPELARGLGKSVSEFKKATNEAEKEMKSAMDEVEKPTDKKAQAEISKSAHGSN